MHTEQSTSPPNSHPARESVGSWFSGFGALRLMLVALTVGLIALGPVSGGAVSFEGTQLLTTLLAPTCYVIVLFVLPLDMTMARVFMSGATEFKRQQLKRVIITEAVLFTLMITAWLPFVLKLLRIA